MSKCKKCGYEHHSSEQDYTALSNEVNNGICDCCRILNNYKESYTILQTES